MEKVYQVEFMQYTNSMRDTIWNEETDHYIDVGKEPFLIKESELDNYKDYGNGFRIIKFVGNIGV